jgi:hypothetical protein
MLVSKLIYYDEKNILPSAHQVKFIRLNFSFRTLYNFIHLGGWNELRLVATRLNKLMIIFDMNVIL